MTEGIEITRVFDAPRERMWQEWTEPERFADWFGGDADIPIGTVSMDVREGGEWRLTMFYGPDRRELRWQGGYHEVVPPERLVLTISDDGGASHELLVVVLTDLGDGRTEMHFEQRGDMTPEQYKAAGAGWGGFFDRLATRVS